MINRTAAWHESRREYSDFSFYFFYFHFFVMRLLFRKFYGQICCSFTNYCTLGPQKIDLCNTSVYTTYIKKKKKNISSFVELQNYIDLNKNVKASVYRPASWRRVHPTYSTWSSNAYTYMYSLEHALMTVRGAWCRGSGRGMFELYFIQNIIYEFIGFVILLPLRCSTTVKRHTSQATALHHGQTVAELMSNIQSGNRYSRVKRVLFSHIL